MVPGRKGEDQNYILNTKLTWLINICVPLMNLALFWGAWDTSLNKNKDSSFHSEEGKGRQNLEKTDNKQ